MFDKYLKLIPREKIYFGLRVRKDTVSNTSNQGDTLVSNVFVYTYTSDNLAIFIKENDIYTDTKLKKNVSPIDKKDLCSFHLDYSNTYLNRSNYPIFNKNDLYGVFSPISLVDMINSIENTDSILEKPKYDKEKEEYTIAELEILLKEINKYLGGKEDYVEGPLVKKDNQDPQKADYNNIEEFLKDIEGLSEFQIKELMKRKKTTIEEIN